MGQLIIPHRFEPRDYQLPILKALDGGVKRAVAVWHRRSGKEKTFLNYTAKKTSERIGSYFYFFPTFAQARKSIWDGMDRDGFKFMDHFPAEYIRKSDQGEMKLELINGSIFQLIGTDNIDSIMSTNPIGCVFAEFSLQDPAAWDYVRPILKENGGWAIFDFTPRGNNHAHTLYKMAKQLMESGDQNWFAQLLTVKDTGVLTDTDIEAERREGMSEDMIEQEYYCSFKGVQRGSIFGQQMDKAERDGRICGVPWQPDVPVDTAWDIGTGDSTAIWFTQNIGREVHVIDYYEIAGVGVDHFPPKLFQERPYTYGQHKGPHDLENRSFAAKGKTTKEVAQGLGINFTVVEKLDKKSQVDAGRAFISRCYFDREKTKRGREALINYHYHWDDKRKCYQDNPYHDWSSNGSDAWQYLAVGHKFSAAKTVKVADVARPMQLSTSNTAYMGV